jgi:hypothetical protein
MSPAKGEPALIGRRADPCLWRRDTRFARTRIQPTSTTKYPQHLFNSQRAHISKLESLTKEGYRENMFLGAKEY